MSNTVSLLQILYCISVFIYRKTYLFICYQLFPFHNSLTGLGCLMYSIDYNSMHHYLLCYSTCSTFRYWELFRVGSCDLLTGSSPFLSTSLLLDQKMLQTRLIFSLPHPQNKLLLQGVLVFPYLKHAQKQRSML